MAESFSQHQIDVFRDCFNLYDKNRDGKVEKEELTKIMRALGHPVTHIEIFEIMKAHGKASVTFPEFVKMLAAQNAKHVNIEREILNAFALQDRSRKGYISRGEFEHLLVKGGEQMTKHEVQQLLSQYGFDKMITQINYQELSQRISASSKAW
ncbi:calmodulin-like isoform X1 [Paramuricea clavata]|uniref:Calmodulin-like isoform X1 n=1 Tax=Paramuricea clavata TaxID=317549 RepID=A0A7D9DK75_PARCT|nr:calmodulin-like isoform X1 [Paramuricea clavata]